jgi:phosphonate transport system substrate-binding protein
MTMRTLYINNPVRHGVAFIMQQMHSHTYFRFPVSLAGLLCLSLLMLTGCERENNTPQGPVYATDKHVDSGVYHFAIHLGYNPKKLMQVYQPLIDHLNQHIPGTHFVLEGASDFKAFIAKIRAREPEFILANPWQTLEAIKAGYHVMAIAGQAEEFKGIFIIRTDSTIKTLSDIKGKTVSYPSPTAVAACVMPQYFLHQHGINIHHDIKNIYVGSQDSSIMSAYLKQSDIAASWPTAWRAFQKDHAKEAAALRVIWETPYLENNAFLVRDDMPADITNRLRDELTTLKQSASGLAAISAMETDHIHLADDSDYKKVRDYIQVFEKEVRPVETP